MPKPHGNSCGPQNITGRYRQTIFLGSSVQSVSCSLGMNEQSSTLTVTLVDDPCVVPENEPAKVYFPRPGQFRETRQADPGFLRPVVGSPVYFRLGGEPEEGEDFDPSNPDIFEFSGIIQSWNIDHSTNGNPVYTVQIIDPRSLLQQTQVIVSDYADRVYHGTPNPPMINIINAYGWMEHHSDQLCPYTLVSGATFGSPAGGFGGSRNNRLGTPFNLLKEAIPYLLNKKVGKTAGMSANELINPEIKFSPWGMIGMRGPNLQADFVDFEGSREGFGLLYNPSDDLIVSGFRDGHGIYEGLVSGYYLDISEVPFAPEYYRIAGPSVNILDLVTETCRQAACDFYIELIVNKQNQKFIKVRTISRAFSPSLGTIESMINDPTNEGHVIAKNIGHELRNEPTSVFMYGGYRQTVYQQDEIPSQTIGEIIQYWGLDSEGAFHSAQKVLADDGVNLEWQISLDVRPLNLALSTPIASNYIVIKETELRMALGDFDSWFNHAFIKNTPFGQHLKTALGFLGPQITFDGIKGNGYTREFIAKNLNGLLSTKIRFQPDQDVQDPKDGDVKKIHSYIEDWADTYYGKQFLVQLPYVCFKREEDSVQIQYSDMPTNDGGWPMQGTSNVLGLPLVDAVDCLPDDPLIAFSDETNKIQPFVRYYKTQTGSQPKEGEFITFTPTLGGAAGIESLYTDATVEEKPVIYTNPAGNVYATALIKVSNPVQMSGLEGRLAGINPQFGGLIELAYNDSVSTADIEKLNFALRFSPDNQKGTDSSFSIIPKRRTPSEAAIPMKSMMQRYGPLNYAGPPGPVHFEANDSLVPWEYGGWTRMNAAAIEIAGTMLKTQAAERGAISLPGTPTQRLGSYLTYSQDTFYTVNKGSASFNIDSSRFTYNYLELTQGPQAAFLPNITNIQISMGANGFTTSYSLSSFTTQFGRFAKANAARLKQMGQLRADLIRADRERRKLRKAIAAAEGRAARSLKNLMSKNKRKQNATNANNIKVGQQEQGPNINTSKRTVGINVVSESSRTLQQGTHEFDGTTGWGDLAVASEDALFRPFKTPGANGNLPSYPTLTSSAPWDSCDSERPHQTRQINPPFNGGTDYVPLIINTTYLDAFALKTTDKHGDSPTAVGNHTDVSIAAHGTTPPSIMHLDAYERDGNAYPGGLRSICMRGPLMIHGWGYDLDGKPIPNNIDTEAAASGGTFQSVGLKDKFLDYHLRMPHTWPVAPVDLRFDRSRGVWTSPLQYKMVRARAATDIASGAEKDDVVVTDMGVTANPVYDANGNTFAGTIKVKNPSFNPDILAGDEFFAVYDTTYCVYFPLIGGSSNPCWYNSGVCFETAAYGCPRPDDGCWESRKIVMGYGLVAEEVTNLTPPGHHSDCATCVSGTGTLLKIRIPTLDCASTGCLDQGSPSLIGGGCHAEWGGIVLGSGMRGYAGTLSDGDGSCPVLYMESTAPCLLPATLTCAQSKAQGWVDGINKGKLETGGTNTFCKGLVGGAGIAVYRVKEGTYEDYGMIETTLSVSSGCGAEDEFINSVETIKLGCGLSGTLGTKENNTGVCDVEININPFCGDGAGHPGVTVVADVCCSGGSGLIIAYKDLKFTKCGLFTGVDPWYNCEGQLQTYTRVEPV
jgi:hypothetical protein